MTLDELNDERARLNAATAQFEAASFDAFMRRDRRTLNYLARDLGHHAPQHMQKAELVGWIKAQLVER